VDVADVEDEIKEPESSMIEEQMFTFDKFEAVRDSILFFVLIHMFH
jgi:hypothetical protein